jgi:hypothetical protein
MLEYLSSLYDTLPLARTIYSLFLIAIIILVAGHLTSVWSRGKISVSDFSYFSNGKKDADHAEQLRSETIANYSMIVGLIEAYNKKLEDDEFPSPCQSNLSWYQRIPGLLHRALGMFQKREDEPPDSGRDDCKKNANDVDVRTHALEVANSVHDDNLKQIANTLDITVEGVSVRGLFSAVSNLVMPAKTELVASVYETNGKKRAYVSAAGNSAPQATKGFSSALPSVSSLDAPEADAEDAFRIACYLIWYQVNFDNDQSGRQSDRPKISFEEFCDWAKLLSIKSDLETADAYRLDERKKALNIDFVKQQIMRATQLDLNFNAIYTTLSEFRIFIGSETVKFGERTEIAVNALADLIHYFSVTQTTARDNINHDWLKSLGTAEATGQAVNSAYFKQFIKTDCQPDDDLQKEIKAAMPNIVRINRKSTNTRTKVVRTLMSTGLIIDDDLILTVYPGPQDPGKLSQYFADTTVSSVQCGNVQNPSTVKSAAFATVVGKSPYVILNVPGLKRQAANPERDFDGPDVSGGGSQILVVGHIRDTTLTFADISAIRASDASHSDNQFMHLLSGKTVADYDSDYSDDSERRVSLSVPFSSGLTGSPIFDNSGDLVGFVESSARVGKNLSIAIGVSIESLKNVPSLKNVTSSDKED